MAEISKRITLLLISIPVEFTLGLQKLTATFTYYVGILTIILNSLLFYRENDRCLGELAKKPPLYMATYGKHKMRSNIFSSASARGEYLFVFGFLQLLRYII